MATDNSNKDILKKNLSSDDVYQPQGLNPDPQNLNPDNRLDFRILQKLVGTSVVSSRQFNKSLVAEICRFAAVLQKTEIATSHPLDGKIIITAFFEPSTRTRLSFESATLRLDGKILSISDAKQTGIAKGESLEDIGEMFNAYGDLVIMRHTDTDSIDRLSSKLQVPLINAGNGSGEHPTQALADWYALLKWKPQLSSANIPEKEKIHLGIIGTPGSMRAVKSFLLMSLLFSNAIKKITIISEMADPFGDDVIQDLKKANVEYGVEIDINTILEDLDVIYMNSIAFLGDSYKNLDTRFRIDNNSKLKKNAVVMHPLARLDELSTTLDKTEHNLYFTQAHGAVYIRQALLISVLNRFDTLPTRMFL